MKSLIETFGIQNKKDIYLAVVGFAVLYLYLPSFLDGMLAGLLTN